MGLKVADLYADLGLRTGPFDGVMGRLPAMFGPVTGAAVLGTAAIGAAFVGLSYKIGASFDAAYDTIRVGTGATGKALEGLKADFKAVVKDVPTDFESAGTAIADINTRTGATGKRLQGLSKQLLEVSRITKSDVSSNIRNATRFFGDWSIATGKQSDALDLVFRASQSTGMAFGELMDLAVQFGAPLRMLGYDMADTVTMLGKWEKEGVNTTTVLSGLKFALKSFAREQRDPQVALRQTMRDIRNAKTETEAAGIAAQVFGQRAGSDLAAAIREGRFEIDDLKRSLKEGKGTILGAAEATKDLKERWQEVKNKLMVAFEPLATKVFEGIAQAGERLAGWVEDHSDEIAAGFRGIAEAIKGIYDAVLVVLTPIFQLRDALREITAAHTETVEGWNKTMKDVEPLILADPKQVESVGRLKDGVGDLEAAVVDLYRKTGAHQDPSILNEPAVKNNLDNITAALSRWQAELDIRLDQMPASGERKTRAYATALRRGLISNIHRLLDDANTLGDTVDDGVKKGLGDGRKPGSAFGGQLASGINSKRGAARSAGSNVGGAGKQGLESSTAGAFGIGAAFGQGFADGITSKANSARRSGAAIAAAAAAGVKATGQVESPSKLMRGLGAFFGQGFALGLRDLVPAVRGAAGALGAAGTAVAGHGASGGRYGAPVAAGGLTFINEGTIVGIDDLSAFLAEGYGRAQLAAGAAAARG